MSKKLLVLCIFISTIIGIAYIVSRNKEKQNKPLHSQKKTGTENNNQEKNTSEYAEANQTRPSKHYLKPETVPAYFDGFYEWDQSKRLNEVTKICEDNDLNEQACASAGLEQRWNDLK